MSKASPVMLASQMDTSSNPRHSTCKPAPYWSSWESNRRWCKPWGPWTHMRYLEKASGSWLQFTSALATAAFLGSELVEGRTISVFMSLSLFHCAFQVNKKKYLKIMTTSIRIMVTSIAPFTRKPLFVYTNSSKYATTLKTGLWPIRQLKRLRFGKTIWLIGRPTNRDVNIKERLCSKTTN